MVITYMLGGSFSGSTKRMLLLTIYSLTVGLSLAYGNGWVAEKISTRFAKWTEKPNYSLAIAYAAIIAFSTIDVIIVNILWVKLVFKANASILLGPWKITLISEIIMAVFIATFFYALNFLKKWKQTVQHQEQLKKEAINMQYEALKNQVNPHFLFNSLNVLSNLVNVNKEQSLQFIKQMSFTYRYILDQQNKELVDLPVEIDFIKSYLFMQQNRFPEKLHVNMELSNIAHFKIVPITLQILLENALKHNEISEEKPLYIKLFIDESEMLVVKNNLQPKPVLHETTRIGLKNLKNRYEYLTGKEFLVQKTDTEFIVKIPLLK